MINHLKQLESFDIVKRELNLNNHNIYLMYLSSLSSNDSITYIIQGFLFSEHQDPLVIFNGSLTPIKSYSQAVFMLLSGQCLVIIKDEVIAIETRSYPNRGIQSPTIEKSIRGSQDSFTENILFNVGLIRRRIRNENLRIELNQEGQLTKTDISLCYLNNKVNQQLLKDLKNRIKNNKDIEINNERNLIEVLYGKTYNPYPHVRYTERPDICAIHLLQGSIILLVDNMPSSIIIPTTLIEQIQQIEEYTQTPIIAFFTRIIRLLGITMSIYLLPFIMLCILTNKSYINNDINLNIPFIIFQILICEIIIEWIRQSFLYAPNLITSMMGFVVVFVLGDFGIELKAYSKEILLLVALSNLGNFLTPSYEISLANKFSRIILTLLTLMFNVFGFCLGIILHMLLLLNTNTNYHNYLYPIFPFDFKEFKRLLFDTNIYTK